MARGRKSCLFAIAILCLFYESYSLILSSSKSSFQGTLYQECRHSCNIKGPLRSTNLTMRKQKASNKRTRRLQREGNTDQLNSLDSSFSATGSRNKNVFPSQNIIGSPMAGAVWDYKNIESTSVSPKRVTGGRGRSRKRSNVYDSLSSYHTDFLRLLTAEYQAEVSHKQNVDLKTSTTTLFHSFEMYELFIKKRKKKSLGV